MYLGPAQIKAVKSYMTGKNKSRYILYGTGKIAAEVIELFKKSHIPVPAFVCDHMEYEKHEFCGIAFKKLSEIITEDFDYIFLATCLHHDEMLEKIKEKLGDVSEVYMIPPEPIASVLADEETERIAESEHYLILSKVFALSECTEKYFLYGSEQYASELIELVRFHKLKLPDAVLMDNSAGGFCNGVRICSLNILDGNPEVPVVLAGHRNTDLMVRNLEKALRRYHQYVDLFKDKTLKYSYYSYIDIPFLANVRMIVGVTSSCNAACLYCPKHSRLCGREAFRPTEWHADESMAIEKYAGVVKEFKGHVSRVDVAGIGEPLLYRNIVEFVRYTSEQVGQVGIITNGMLLSEKMSLDLASAGLTHLAVSLDSLDSRVNMKLRHTDSEKILKNVEFFSRNTGVPVQINAAGTNLNFNSFKEFPALKKRIPSLHSVCAGTLMEYPHLKSKLQAQGLRPFNLAEIFELDQHTRKIYEQCGVGLYLEDKFMPRKRFYGDICNLPWGDPASDFMAYSIECNGCLRLCQGFFYLDNVFEMGFMNAINGPKIRKMRIDFLNGNYPAACKCLCGY